MDPSQDTSTIAGRTIHANNRHNGLSGADHASTVGIVRQRATRDVVNVQPVKGQVMGLVRKLSLKRRSGPKFLLALGVLSSVHSFDDFKLHLFHHTQLFFERRTVFVSSELFVSIVIPITGILSSSTLHDLNTSDSRFKAIYSVFESL